ncbi:LysR family transcriptional regulator [Pseudomonas capsici]|uniref:LysR family transcriptional regulator n=1 Tax=Pseudomonas capsici TaxID=2810614 RepID=UPI0019107333|nr:MULTISPECIES: LysR family transcriptional regulator [Pseudomonas]MBX8612749.1 LysR family transcriptional regulator [Pseudomonas cichorii]MCV4261372.1 LysR family transcriptional regulator [Pseudomonas capsici]MCV4271490.1 LysR family transcriptional regulator [Pseudomonas capsici]MCV4291421.1 LysR family transcriptional regulator [Pseudomonas capsici]GFM49569.1 LysR family transcriptional regulator [Pseudomonas cichorii]
MDKLQAMQAFVTVVDCGSQTTAADKLGLSRPVISRLLAELEEWTGARLMHRTTRRLNLTAAGAEVLPLCRRMLDLAEDMRAVVAAPDNEPKGLLRITSSTSFGQSQLTQAVTEFVARYSQVRIDMVLLDRTVNLVDEGLDLAIRITNDLDPNLIARRLTTCRSVVCASPAYLEEHSIPDSIEDLALHNCLTHTYHSSSLWHFTRKGVPHSVAVKGNLSTNDSITTLQAALCGAGIALLPTYLAAPLIKSGRLVPLLIRYEPMELSIHAVYTSRKHMSSALRALLDFLAERFAPEPAWDRS